MSKRLSRPSSAASHSSSRSSASDTELRLECKAAFLSIFDDLRDVINSEDDLTAVMQQTGRNPSKKTLAKYWTRDTDYLTFEDFVNVCRHEHATTEDDLMKAFRKIDINGDGYISLDELFRMLTTRGEKMSREEVKEMIDEVDDNRDGRLDYREFCNMLMTTTEECKKMSMKLMDKKDRKRKGGRSELSATPRRGEDSIHGSRTSLRSNSSVKRSSASRRSGSLTSVKSHDMLTEDEIEEDVQEDSNTKDDIVLSSRSSFTRSPRKLQRKEKHGSLLSLRSNCNAQTEEDEDEIAEDIQYGEDREEISRIFSQSPFNSPKKRSQLTSNDNTEHLVTHPEMFGSKSYLKSPRKTSDSRAPSHSSLRSVGRTGSKSSLISVDDIPRPSPRVRKDKVQSAVGSSRSARLSEPSNLREWTHNSSKGCFFVDLDEGFQIISHQYTLDLPNESNVFITIHPTRIADAGYTDDGPVDTALYVLKEKSSSVDRVITFTEQRDSKGKYGVRCDLPAGKYRLIPFTTGCRLRERSRREMKEAKLIKKDKDDKIVLTKTFKKALEDIFDLVDLDGNSLLSREEFSWFNIRTSGEDVQDDEWAVVEGNIELENDEITKVGFVHLNEMEAEDNEGDTDDLWVTLTSMGFNKALALDQACPFKVDVYTEDCDDAELRVAALEGPGEQLDDAVCESVIAKGEVSRVKNMKDLNIYTYVGDARATIVVENKSYSRVKVELDCSRSKNVTSNQRDLHTTLTVPSNTTVVGHHLIPKDERSEWVVRCQESILK